MKTKIAIVTILSVALLAAGARAASVQRLPVKGTWATGAAGVVELVDGIPFDPGLEFPVQRGGGLVGMFRVSWVGRLNVWGHFQSHDKTMQLASGDMLIITGDAPRPVMERKVTAVDAQIVYSIPSLDKAWCVIDRGAADGLVPQTSWPVRMERELIGDIALVFVGEHRAYGMLSLREAGWRSDYAGAVVSFR